MIDWLRTNWLMLVPSVVLAFLVVWQQARARALDVRLQRAELALLGLHFAHASEDAHALFLKGRRIQLPVGNDTLDRAVVDTGTFARAVPASADPRFPSA